MLSKVDVQRKSLESYRAIVGDALIQEILDLAGELTGARVVHINATAFGGGVAEMLQSLVPLMTDVGLQAEWRVIAGEAEFFNVTKSFHNGLQGMDLRLTPEMKSVWERYNLSNAQAFEGDYDFVVVHDPQPAGLRHYHRDGAGGNWIWRSHIDTSHPNMEYWEFLVPFLRTYQAAVFSMSQYVGVGLDFPELAVIRPSIDPLTPKNRSMDLSQAKRIASGLGVDLDRPVICQVSRYDPWKDPLGVIDAYRVVKREFPGAQLVLLASMASDDPEGWDYLEFIKRHAADDVDIHLLYFERNNDLEVNAFQTLSDVVVQKSVREGFGLVVTEAMWKGQAVVGGAAGGIPLQITDGETGFLVRSVEECAERMIYLLRKREEAAEMGARAKEHVRANFLVPRHLRDYLQLFRRLSSARQGREGDRIAAPAG
jgi:trehalose synthase